MWNSTTSKTNGCSAPCTMGCATKTLGLRLENRATGLHASDHQPRASRALENVFKTRQYSLRLRFGRTLVRTGTAIRRLFASRMFACRFNRFHTEARPSHVLSIDTGNRITALFPTRMLQAFSLHCVQMRQLKKPEAPPPPHPPPPPPPPQQTQSKR